MYTNTTKTRQKDIPRQLQTNISYKCRFLTILANQTNTSKNDMLLPNGVCHKRQDYFKFKKLTGAIHHTTKPKEKIHIVIVIGIENMFNKIQYPFSIKFSAY